MPGESTHRSVPTDKHPEQGAEETGLPGPGRTFGLGWRGENGIIKQVDTTEDIDQGIIERRG